MTTATTTSTTNAHDEDKSPSLLEAAPVAPPTPSNFFSRHPSLQFLSIYYVLANTLLDRSLRTFPSFLSITHILSLIAVFAIWVRGYRRVPPGILLAFILAGSLANNAAEGAALFALGWGRGLQGVAVHGLAGVMCVAAGWKVWQRRDQLNGDDAGLEWADAVVQKASPEEALAFTDQATPAQPTPKPWNSPGGTAFFIACFTIFAGGMLARKDVPPFLQSMHVFILLIVLGTWEYGWQRISKPRGLALALGMSILWSVAETTVEIMKEQEKVRTRFVWWFVAVHGSVSMIYTVAMMVGGVVCWWQGEFVGLWSGSEIGGRSDDKLAAVEEQTVHGK